MMFPSHLKIELAVSSIKNYPASSWVVLGTAEDREAAELLILALQSRGRWMSELEDAWSTRS